ncbi:hypothetical protein CO053_02470, partial [Candidatus Shapirobacteria bacterium CG_4_9_14_0_2_um_filter_40_11]
VFSLRHPSAEEFIKETQNNVGLLARLVEEKQTDAVINPDLSSLRWFGEAGELPYFKPSKLLSLLKAPESDLENGWVVLETRTNSPEAADRI